MLPQHPSIHGGPGPQGTMNPAPGTLPALPDLMVTSRDLKHKWNDTSDQVYHPNKRGQRTQRCAAPVFHNDGQCQSVGKEFEVL